MLILDYCNLPVVVRCLHKLMNAMNRHEYLVNLGGFNFFFFHLSYEFVFSLIHTGSYRLKHTHICTHILINKTQLEQVVVDRLLANCGWIFDHSSWQN